MINNYEVKDIILTNLNLEKNVDVLPETGIISCEFSTYTDNDYVALYKLVAEDKEKNNLFSITASYRIIIECNEEIEMVEKYEIDKMIYNIIYPELRQLFLSLTNKMGINGVNIPRGLGK